MLRVVSLVVLSAAFLVVASCGPGSQDEPPGGSAPVQSVEIRLGVTGLPVVSVDSIGVERGDSPVIRWSADPSELRWFVAFPVSPFRNGQQFFYGENQGTQQAPIRADAAAGTYKYSVFVADSDSTWVELDPKIVIIDDPTAPSGMSDSLGEGN